ncbi:aminotransferase class V-fold PLP-dependent enzyme [Sphingomonas sp. LY54]|uniref:cysteine desulfurase family protein n=1 Tax=Sphingomonas sp. LY54 TaxID=3095343 RepID=UPI002D79B603|nr:aminotransferase class V-fold PLP-dependent enzyme [Sphingomonas sp. LY54]WRP28760.1 aminotransferase class V-fold PLP-dependent enzyme [Sphingomonas sp. LY54]
MPQGRIYLDHAATTRVLPVAQAAMADALAAWANPSSPHADGRAAKAKLEEARTRIARALGWTGKILFTSGASEALAIVLHRAMAGTRYVSAVEHDAVARAAPNAVTLPVGSDGIVDLTLLKGERPLVAVQHANNETGVLQPLGSIADEVHARAGLLLADCAQTAGKLPLPDADFIALSAHKFGGPPGVGALLVRDFAELEAVGGQEQGYRPGTENLPAILAMAAALEAGHDWLDEAAVLRERLETALAAAGAEIVGGEGERIATIGAYRMAGVPANAQLIQFDMAGIAVSAGSACSSGSLKASHVLAAMGWDEGPAREVVRVSFGPSTTAAEIDRFAALWTEMKAKRRAA